MTTYDVFLSHASADKPFVEALARRLRGKGLKPFLDKWHLVPGEPWQEALEAALEASRTCAVFIGREDGPWRHMEMRAALSRLVADKTFRVIPVLLHGGPVAAELPPFLSQVSAIEWRHGLDDDDDAYHRLVCGIRGVPPDAGDAPPPTPKPYRSMATPADQFVHRRELDAVRDLLLDADAGTVGITTALRGAGGFGKTILAQALCEDPQVREAYPDGILWAQMRDDMKDADRLDMVLDLVRFLRPGEMPGFETVSAAGAHLREVLDGRRVLVVVDDAWKSADVEPFRGLGPGTAVLVTTRDRGTVPPDFQRVNVDAMQLSEAVRLLASGIPSSGDSRLDALAERLGEWPLLLELANRQLRELMKDEGLDLTEAVLELEEELVESGVTAFDLGDGTERGRAVAGTLHVSLRCLKDEERRCFLDLAVFPEDVDIPFDMLERLWGKPAVGKLCRRFRDLSLLLRFERAAKTIRLHDVVRQYLIDECGDLPELHRRLLERCRPPSGRWSDLDDGEGYLWRHLAGHLVVAGNRSELRRLLFDLDYLEAKLRAAGAHALQTDFSVLGDMGEAHEVQEVLRLSAHVLERDWGGLLPQVLAGQLLGRMEPVEGEAGRLLRSARGRARLRPRRVVLTRPGGTLVRILDAHAPVSAVAALDARRVVSGSAADNTLRLWDVGSGEVIGTLEGHTTGVNAVAVLDESRLVSGSQGHPPPPPGQAGTPPSAALRIWDLASGKTVRRLEVREYMIEAVVVLDERRVISASWANYLWLWDVTSGETIRILEGHTSSVSAVAVLSASSVVSASADRTLRVWDVESGETLRVLEGHTGAVQAVATLDDSHVISASGDQTLRIWDVRSGKNLRTFEGPDQFGTIALLNRSRVIALPKYGRDIQIWDLETGQIVQTLRGHSSSINAVAVLDETRVISASSDGTVRIWDTAEVESPIRTEEKGYSVNALAVLDDTLAISADFGSALRVWDISSGETIRTFGSDRHAVVALAAIDKTRAVMGTLDGILWVADTASGDTLRAHRAHGAIITAVARLGDHRVVSASRDKTLRIWDVATGELIRVLEGHRSDVEAVAPLGERRLISASYDSLRIWDVESGEAIRKLGSPQIQAVAALDWERVVVASGDQTLKILNVESGDANRTFAGHTGRVVAVAVLDQQRLVSASDDKTVRVWDVESGETTAVFVVDAPLKSLAVTSDGRVVIAGADGGGVYFLDLELPG